MGTITYSSIGGTTLGQYKPYEFAIDAGYSRRIAKYWSLGIALRFIHSDLTNGITIANRSTYPGRSYAGDFGAYYMDRERVKILSRPCVMMMGVALTNVGSKIKYTDSAAADFIPINLRVGQGFRMNFNSRNSLSFQYELNKLLVPTPPVYALDSNGNRIMNSSGQYVIAAGKDPNVSVAEGMIQSFNDAPGGGKEELSEINYCIGFEYMYNNTFAVRTGYFYEARTKGNRQFIT